jgi:glycosyltransferase involved in cell wall biosynthesis
MKSAIILGRSNGVGLDRDAALLGDALAARGVTVKCPRLRNLADALSSQFNADAAFHLERVAPWWWRRKAKKHFLIPNQERFPLRLVSRLESIDSVLCKSRHAEEIFSPLHPHVRFTGFTSPDRLDPEVDPDYRKFLHLAGRSTLKNTGLLLELWSQHPEWPPLTLVQHPDNAPKSVPANVNLISRYLPDDELRTLQNQHGVHLCPSLSEGWGHYIVEAMSCRATVLVTDAPPMNELVTPDRGITVPYSHSEPRHLGRNFHADPLALETSISQWITLPASRKKTLGDAGRAWFEENHRLFTARLAELDF